jgi:hypothetical protein
VTAVAPTIAQMGASSVAIADALARVDRTVLELATPNVLRVAVRRARVAATPRVKADASLCAVLPVWLVAVVHAMGLVREAVTRRAPVVAGVYAMAVVVCLVQFLAQECVKAVAELCAKAAAAKHAREVATETVQGVVRVHVRRVAPAAAALHVR